MISKKELNLAIDLEVYELCVETLKNPTGHQFPVETCEKILREQFGYTTEVIEKIKHSGLRK